MAAAAGPFERTLSRCLAGVLFDERGTVLERILSIDPSELHDPTPAYTKYTTISREPGHRVLGMVGGEVYTPNANQE